MKLTAIREHTIPLHSKMRNAVISFRTMTASLIVIETDVVDEAGPVLGLGYTAPGRYSQAGPLRDRLIPRVLEMDPADLVGDDGVFEPQRLWQRAQQDEKPGGRADRSVALAALDLAAWDLAGKLLGRSVARLLADRSGVGEPAAVPVYAAGGYYYGDDRDAHQRLRSELRGYVDAGYSIVKMKIGGAPLDDDRGRIEAALDEIGGRAELAVDANAAFGLDTARRYGQLLAGYPIAWYEEPVRPLDLHALRILVDEYDGPIATGENLFSEEEVELLLRFGGLRPGHDMVQVDAGLAGGITGFGRVLKVAEDIGWDISGFVPHGGHLANLAVASGRRLGGAEAYPGLFRPIAGFGSATVRQGRVSPSTTPGLGVEGHPELLAAFQGAGEEGPSVQA